jgi:hypothetical protein
MATERKEPVLYVDKDLHNDSIEDPADYGFPTAAEAPETIFDSTWRVQASQKEALVARAFTFGGQELEVRRDEVRRAYGVTNPTTKEVKWVPFDEAKFGMDQTQIVVDLGDYHASGIPQEDTPLARVLQKNSARAGVVEGNRTGKSKYDSLFKPKFDGLRTIRSNG